MTAKPDQSEDGRVGTATPVKPTDQKGKKGKKTNEERIAEFDSSAELFLSNIPHSAVNADVLQCMDLHTRDICLRFRGERFAEGLSKRVGAMSHRYANDCDSKNCYVVFKKGKEAMEKWWEASRHGKHPLYIGSNRISYNPSAQGNSFTVFSPKKSVFLAKLPKDCTVNNIWDALEDEDDLDPIAVRLMRDATGTPKGFGFVLFGDRTSVNKALARSKKMAVKGSLIVIEKVLAHEDAVKDQKARSDSKDKQRRAVMAKKRLQISNTKPVTKGRVDRGPGAGRGGGFTSGKPSIDTKSMNPAERRILAKEKKKR